MNRSHICTQGTDYFLSIDKGNMLMPKRTEQNMLELHSRATSEQKILRYLRRLFKKKSQ